MSADIHNLSIERSAKAIRDQETEIRSLIEKLGAMEDTFQRLEKLRKAAKDRLKVLMPERGVERASGFGVEVECNRRTRRTLKKDLVKELLSEEEFASCLLTTSYYELTITPIPVADEE